MVVGVGNAPTKSLDERFTVSCNILSATQQLKMACLKGLKPLTFWVETKDSVQLSYRHIKMVLKIGLEPIRHILVGRF